MNPPTRADVFGRPLAALAAAAGAIGLAVAVGYRLAEVLPPAYVVMIFLMAVLVTAALAGLWSGIVAAFGSFFAYNFFFVEPTFTLVVADPREVFALGAFLLVAVLTGGLAGRLREVADAARRRADTVGMLHDFAERVSATRDADEIRSLVVRRVAERIHGTAVLFDRRVEDGAAPVAHPRLPDLTAEERRAAARVFETGRIEAAAAPGFEERRIEFRPLRTAAGVVAVVGLAPASGRRVVAGEDEQGLSALLDQAATALERVRFAEERSAAEAAAEQERLRSALLSSLSHDLRTPLSTILGSVTSLRQLGDRMEPEDRDDLLAAIEEETDRLSRFVADLLAMTRLEAGIDVRRSWTEVGDVARAAVEHVRRVHVGRRFGCRVTTDPTLVRADSMLLEQVLFNLLDNAAKASPPGVPVTLTVDLGDREIRVEVVDRGRGLSVDEIERLFVRAQSRTASLTPENRGGLGLAIARRVVSAMGGTIGAESPAVDGVGTRVILTLPLEAVAEPGEVEEIGTT